MSNPAEQRLEEMIKIAKEESPEEARIRRKTVCYHCKFYDSHFGNGGGSFCDYRTKMGTFRPCAAQECKEKGVFVHK